MRGKLNTFLSILGVCSLLAACAQACQAVAQVHFFQEPDKLLIHVGDQQVATYVHRDARISRPYFAHLHAPGGVQVTRNHPPIEGQDATDHATFHPGLWLAFGDISGQDYWRLKAPVVHDRFIIEPSAIAGGGTFAVRNRYLSADRKRTICEEDFHFTLLLHPAGYLLVWDSQFRSPDGEFYFGDQEEMGLGIRVATPIATRQGGQILDSEGRKNERNVWGRQALWCDYRGTIQGQRVGITLMPDPANFRRCWYHARDYGFVCANPFGRKAFSAGPASKIVVERGKTLRLRWGVLLHGDSTAGPVDINAAYGDFLERIESLRAETENR